MFDLSFSPTLFSQHFTSTFVGAEELTANEKLLTGTFSNKRLKDFSTGRFCARKALAQIGYGPDDILMGDDKQPLWPSGTIGSISHSKYLTGAVVGLASQFRSIGLDVETMGKITAEMWRMLYTETEQDFLNSCPYQDLAYYTTLLFSFKESFYKLQFPLTHTFLEFTDVEVAFTNQKFQLKVLKQFPGIELLPESIPLFYRQDNEEVITLCYLY